MTHTEMLLIRLSILLDRDISFQDIYDNLGSQAYILAWERSEYMVNAGLLRRFSRTGINRYEPTEKGLAVYRSQCEITGEPKFTLLVQKVLL